MPTAQEIHYLFDTRTAFLIGAVPINVEYPEEVTATNGGEFFDSDATGGFVLRIPAGIDFDPKRTEGQFQNWLKLNIEKHSATLAQYPGFTDMISDDIEDATGFSTALAVGVHFGGRGTFSMGPTSASTVRTVVTALGSTPVEAILNLEAYHYVPSIGYDSIAALGLDNPKTSRPKRIFRPVNASTYLQFDVSFNNAGTFINDVSLGTIITIPGADQGPNFILRITRRSLANPTGRIGIGAWSLIY